MGDKQGAQKSGKSNSQNRIGRFRTCGCSRYFDGEIGYISIVNGYDLHDQNGHGNMYFDPDPTHIPLSMIWYTKKKKKKMPKCVFVSWINTLDLKQSLDSFT